MADRDAPDAWRGTLTLPDRTVVRGRGVRNPTPRGAAPDFGLYLGVDYTPDWPHEWVAWPNYGLPRDARATAHQIEELYERARGWRWRATPGGGGPAPRSPAWRSWPA